MNEDKLKELESRGYTVTDADTFFGLTETEKSLVELRKALSDLTREFQQYKQDTNDRLSELESEVMWSLPDTLREIRSDISYLERNKQDS